MKKTFIIALTITLLILMIPFGGYLYYHAMLKSVAPDSTETVNLDIPMGTSLTKAAKILKENNLIRDEKVFRLYAKLNGLENIKSGNYNFESGDNVGVILEKLNSGDKPIGTKVTIPEGYEIINIAEKLTEMGLIDEDSFIQLTKNKESFVSQYPFLAEDDIQSLEGYLYPDTYFITKEMTEEDIIRLFLDRFQQIYEENNMSQRLKDKNLTLNELITMASVVEREAVLDEERPVIAGVFYNRIKVNMPLQSCATVQYILKERKPILSLEDTKIDSPYNTYQNKGLPPTPIASPGIRSIEATLHPQKTDYLFFVARGDGGHEFSVTYEEHLKAKKKYLGE